MRLSPTIARIQMLLQSSAIAAPALAAVVAISLLASSQPALAADNDASTPLFSATGREPKPAMTDQVSPNLSVEPSPTLVDSRRNKPFQSEQLEGAVLFLNGEFVPPPYVVSTDADRILINGIELVVDEHILRGLRDMGNLGSVYADLELEDLDADDDSENSISVLQSVGVRRVARALAEMLRCPREVDVANPGEPLMLLTMTDGGLELLTALQTKGKDPQLVDRILNRLRPEADRQRFRSWIQNFESTEVLAGVVKENAEFLSASEARNKRDIAATSLLRTMSYPMSIAGLFLSVVAFGHVVANKPPTRYSEVADELTPEMRDMVNRSLLLVIALSLMDLIWTLLASQANQMSELNPLGREFISNPLLLGAFKFVLTGAGVGLLYTLKKHRIAQTAAWWACMILTLLTMRWLTFNSMFA